MSNSAPVSGGRRARRPLSHARARVAALACALAVAPLGAAVIDFSDVPLTGPAVATYAGPGGGVYYNGSDGAGSFASGGASFNNNFTDWGYGFTSWANFAYSTTSDTTTSGYVNEYSAYSSGNSGAYGIAYFSAYDPAPRITFAQAVAPQSVLLTNTTYAALDMLSGASGFSKKFGGATGDDPDWFRVTFTGYDASSAVTGTVVFYLADFRFSDNSLDYIVDDWTSVDLSGLGSGVRAIELSFASSDVGMFGINTPTYVAFDNLAYTPVPEPSAFAGFAGLGALAFALRRRPRRSAA